MAGNLRLALLLLFVLAVPARADDIERITDFSQDLTVAADGTVQVVERIAVNAQGDFLIHGIYRDFPTIYRGTGNVHVRFAVTSVQMDGRDTPYTVQALDNGRRIQMGDPDAEMRHGPHIFTLHYVTDRQIGFFAGHDELYWNVTGTGWNLAISRAHAVIHLPPNARISAWDFFTGGEGTRGKAARAAKRTDNSIAFETTQVLDPNQGLTVVVDFTKGAVAPPTRADRWRYLLRDNRGAFGALAGIALLCIYFLIAWWLVGRDPKRGTIIPLFAPPHDLSPAAMRFIRRMHYDRKAFAATLVGLAVKDVLIIHETKHLLGPVYSLQRRGAPSARLSAAEDGVAQALLGYDGQIELTRKNQGQIAAAIATLKKSLSDEYEKVFFNQNRNWVWPGLGIIALSCAAAAGLSDNVGGAFLVFLWSGLFGVAAAVFSGFAFTAWRTVVTGHGAFIVNLGIALLRTLAALPFIGVLIGMLFFLNDSLQPVTIFLLASQGGIALLFYRLLRAPTRAGGTLRDEIDGFALYLKTGEQARLETLQPPELTPQLFETFLPYAIALDCETAWGRKFETAMAAAEGSDGPANHRSFAPMWYQGDSFSTLGTSVFASTLSASLGNAAASASAAPGSGSGSGGGGFSGGGGGGGGGGGW